MKISEIEKGSNLVVKVFPKVMKDGVEIRSMRSLDFAVNVQKVYATAIAVDEIKTTSVPAPGGKQGDKKDKGMATVSFQSTKAFIDLYLFEDDTAPVVWENVTIKHARVDKGPCHVIMASKDGVKMNRRHAYRLDVHAPANISIGRDRTSQIQGIVRDVSSNGFAIITTKEDIRGGEEVRAEMFDKETAFMLVGVCVRKRTMQDGRFLYGCKMRFDNPQLRKYINEKQRQRMKTE